MQATINGKTPTEQERQRRLKVLRAKKKYLLRKARQNGKLLKVKK